MIVREHFVFWQQYKESDDAERYMTFYTIADWPYVSIIDPRTGENMVTWSKIEASTFPELITEFLSLHPNLESPAKEPPRKKIRSENILEMDEDAQMGKKNNNYSSDCPKITIYIKIFNYGHKYFPLQLYQCSRYYLIPFILVFKIDFNA